MALSFPLSLNLHNIRSQQNVEQWSEAAPIKTVIASRILFACNLRHLNTCCKAKSDKCKGDYLMTSLVDSRHLQSEKEETKAFLTTFLQSLGVGNAVATDTVKNSDLFVMHLVSMLHLCNQTQYLTGRELRAIEIRNALLPYLEGLAREDREGITDVILHFPNIPAQRECATNDVNKSRSISKRNTLLAELAEYESAGDLHPSLMYLLDCGLDLEQVKALVERFPAIVTYSMEGKMKTTVELLLQLGIRQSDIRRIIVKAPQLFGRSLDNNVKPIIAYLESLGVDRHCWGKVIMKFPALLTYSKRKFDLLVNFMVEMGVSSSATGKILTRYPHIVSYSVEDNLRPTAAYFKSMGIDPGLLALHCPQTFTLSLDANIMPITEFFLDVGFSMNDISKMVNKFANIYQYSLADNLRPKWYFFVQMGRSKSQLLQFPQYFGYSLEGRIKPRQKVLEQSGVVISVNRMLSTTDDDFQGLVRRKVARMKLQFSGHHNDSSDSVTKLEIGTNKMSIT